MDYQLKVNVTEADLNVEKEGHQTDENNGNEDVDFNHLLNSQDDEILKLVSSQGQSDSSVPANKKGKRKFFRVESTSSRKYAVTASAKRRSNSAFNLI